MQWVEPDQIGSLLNRADASLADWQKQGKNGLALFERLSGATARIVDYFVKRDQDPGWAACAEDGDRFLFDTQLFQQIDARYFDITFWQQRQAVMGGAQGRSRAWFVRYQDCEMVLRHYYRGGLIGRILHDKFAWQTPLNSRAMQEFRLLAWMRRQGLNVPRPVAAHFQGHLGFYRANILVEKIPGALDLVAHLQNKPLPKQAWWQIGALIGRMHRMKVYHSDLNAHNILWQDQDQQAWLIDFDKCQRRIDTDWQANNLARLQRSLAKEQRLHTDWFMSEDDWPQLLAGYQQSVSAQRC
jgi:3-deoxy-D-manno-octulosonic-acid transferase